MKQKRCLIDTFTGRIYLVGPGGYELMFSPGSVQHDLVESSAGHLMLPCSRFDAPMNPREEVSSFIVGDYFETPPTRPATSSLSGGSPPTSRRIAVAAARQRLNSLVAGTRSGQC